MPSKSTGIRMLELGFFYACAGAVGYAMETWQGQYYSQGWEFYAVTACLFLVFAYPGFVYRHLWRRPADQRGSLD